MRPDDRRDTGGLRCYATGAREWSVNDALGKEQQHMGRQRFKRTGTLTNTTQTHTHTHIAVHTQQVVIVLTCARSML